MKEPGLKYKDSETELSLSKDGLQSLVDGAVEAFKSALSWSSDNREQFIALCLLIAFLAWNHRKTKVELARCKMRYSGVRNAAKEENYQFNLGLEQRNSEDC